jgi:hypothetical protein
VGDVASTAGAASGAATAGAAGAGVAVRLEMGREKVFVTGVDDEHPCRHRLRAAGGRWGSMAEKWIFSRARCQPLLALLSPAVQDLPEADFDATLQYDHAWDADDAVVTCSNGKSVEVAYCCSDELKCFRCKHAIMHGELMLGLNTTKTVKRWRDDDHYWASQVRTTQWNHVGCFTSLTKKMGAELLLPTDRAVVRGLLPSS